MTAPLQITGVSAAALRPGPLHLAIGMFDGVHLGHRAAIEPAIRAARQAGGVAAVLTFWPHPSVLFRPQDPTRLIQSPQLKATVLAQLGLDAIITEPFTTELAGIAAEEFLPGLQRQLPALAGVYVGENFRFGRKRRGDVALLQQSGAALGIVIHSAKPVFAHGEWVSSTRIRGHLVSGQIEDANALLGYSYFAEGTIVVGKRLGRTIGFPTLNLDWSPELRPRFGVYAVRVCAAGSAPDALGLPGVANYGVRPTVENTSEPKLEVHVLGDCPFDAGEPIDVHWLHFIRPEMRFAGLDELRAQIGRDREAAVRFFAAV